MNYYQEEQKLLQVFIDDYIGYSEKLFDNSPRDFIFPEIGIEFIIRPECNQKCEYCYVQKHGDGLYPKNSRASKETTLKNLDALLEYFTSKKIIFRRVDLFAGDLFYDNLFFDCCEILYKHYSKLYELVTRDFEKNLYSIILPCNCAFVHDDEKVKKFDEWRKKFDDIKIDLSISWSSDGIYSSELREGKKLNEEYFDKIFAFIKKHKFGAHPMISPNNIQYAIQNYDWWRKKYEEFEIVDRTDKKCWHFMPMMLEVRDDGWTEEKINLYLQFLQHLIVDRFNMLDNDVDRMARHLFLDTQSEKGKKLFQPGDMPKLWSYDPIIPITPPTTEDYNDIVSCSMQKVLHIRVSDLAIPICHRLTYNHMLGGWFEKDEDDKIIGVKPQNVTTYISAKTIKPSLAPKCVSCFAKDMCFKGCLGSQYETNGDYPIPIDSVCNLLKSRASYLLKVYSETGVLKSAIEQDLLNGKNKQTILNYCDRMGYQYE